MILSIILISFLSNAGQTILPFNDAVKECDASVRWGYFLQDLKTIKKLGGRIDFWDVNKDLTGKFKTREECEESISKLKYSYLAEGCQMFSVGSKEISGRYYYIEAKEDRNLNLESLEFRVAFKDKESCELAKTKGGEYKTPDGKKDIFPNGSSHRVTFTSECKENSMVFCSKGHTTIDVTDVN